MTRCPSSPRSLQWVALSLALLLMPGTAASDGSASLPLPVNQGCFGLASYGIPMHGTGAGSVTVSPPGPILGVYLHWVGVDDETPTAAGESSLTVNGVPVSGNKPAAPADLSPVPNPDWYSWWANIGPAGPPFFGLGLVDDLNPSVDVRDWDTSAGFPATNGAGVTVVYDTGACLVPATIEIQVGVDYYYYGFQGQEASELLVFAFPALPETRVVSFQVSHAGTDATQMGCRGGAIWMLAGSGVAPGPADFDLLERDGSGRGFGVNGGVEILNDPFTSAALPCVPTLNPLPDAPYEPGHPCPAGADPMCPYRALALRPVAGGDVGAEWGVVEVDVQVPAGSSWVAFQLESEADQSGESGSWAGSGLVLAELPLCGDGVLQPGEDCDDGSHCSDGSPCVEDLDCVAIGD